MLRWPYPSRYIDNLVLIGAATSYAALAGFKVLNVGLWTVGASSRGDLYISLATTCAALLGFSITAVTLLMTAGDGPRLRRLYAAPGFQEARPMMMGAIRALSVATVVFSVAIVIDEGSEGSRAFGILEGVVLLWVVGRLGRVVWLLDNLVGISIQDKRPSENAVSDDAEAPLPFTETNV